MPEVFHADVEKPAKAKSSKKKRAKEHAPATLELGDTQSIAFIGGYEYVTNIVNDGVLPKELLEPSDALLAVWNDIKSNVAAGAACECRRSTGGRR